ncbi:competence/damage-inducible protein A [bacterium]|nr:competence/damage-inducible protein A [bacterium]
MRAELLFIGTELLLGQIVNTNAAYLGENLARLGVDVYHSSVIGDNIGRISDAVTLALSRSDLLIVSGGLGPTADDVTRESIARAIGRELVYDPDVMASIEGRFKLANIEVRPIHRKQAYVFDEKCHVINNTVGSAPGLIIEVDGKYFIAMPGVPHEMIRMCENFVFDWIAEKSGVGTIKSRSLKICGLGESTVAERIEDVMEGLQNPTIAFLARPGDVTVRITAKAANDAEAMALISEVEEQVRAKLGGHVYGEGPQTLEMVTGALLAQKHYTISVAETCTCGWIINRLVDVPGSAEFFNRGIVACNEEIVKKLLNVSEDIIKQRGLISAEATSRMAENIREIAQADYSLAVTGILDANCATDEKPLGLTYIALASQDGVQCVENRFWGERPTLKQRISQAALDLLRRRLIGGDKAETGDN